MASRTNEPRTGTKGARQEPPPHALYDLGDVEAALGRKRFTGDPDEDEGPGIHHALLQSMLDAGETGRWRALAHATTTAAGAVSALSARAPHMRAVIDLVVRRLRAAQVTGVPVCLPPILLLGPPGVGKTWLMGRIAGALGVPFRSFAMNLATLGDSLSGSHTLWKASRPGLVATTLLREPVANPLILVDELDKPPERQLGGDLYRPFHSLLEPEGARAFVDDHLGVPIDASRMMWVAAANRLDQIPEPIVDRLTVVEVGPMAHEDRVAVLGSLYADLRAHYRGYFDPLPGPDLLERLAGTQPRRARLAMDDAMSRAAADGRRTVGASDVAGVPPAPRPGMPRRVH